MDAVTQADYELLKRQMKAMKIRLGVYKEMVDDAVTQRDEALDRVRAIYSAPGYVDMHTLAVDTVSKNKDSMLEYLVEHGVGDYVFEVANPLFSMGHDVLFGVFKYLSPKDLKAMRYAVSVGLLDNGVVSEYVDHLTEVMRPIQQYLTSSPAYLVILNDFTHKVVEDIKCCNTMNLLYYKGNPGETFTQYDTDMFPNVRFTTAKKDNPKDLKDPQYSYKSVSVVNCLGETEGVFARRGNPIAVTSVLSKMYHSSKVVRSEECDMYDISWESFVYKVWSAYQLGVIDHPPMLPFACDFNHWIDVFDISMPSIMRKGRLCNVDMIDYSRSWIRQYTEVYDVGHSEDNYEIQCALKYMLMVKHDDMLNLTSRAPSNVLVSLENIIRFYNRPIHLIPGRDTRHTNIIHFMSCIQECCHCSTKVRWFKKEYSDVDEVIERLRGLDGSNEQRQNMKEFCDDITRDVPECVVISNRD
tara:strand:- start:3225 stop:4634 length:1410 start_codon:yes stop_codon:yes gene_type:complete